nr:hypothetical protein BaRGS_007484 [Batillaria attramentaria]
MKDSIKVQYDIWLVNGNPSSKALNPFEHQFSFEFHDVFEIHFAAFLVLLLLLLLWLYAFHKQRHVITKLFTVVLVGELSSTVLSLIHVTVFAFDGEGVVWLSKVGVLVDVVVQCLFMLLLLLMGKGWAITNSELKWKSVLFGICGAYTLLNLFLYIWNLVEIDNIISNTDEWQTWPGYATLAFRLIVMLWFLVELRRTYHHSHLHAERAVKQNGATPSRAQLHRCESNQDINLNFIPHFGAFILLWFVYLPVLALISTQVSALWRYKTILSISYAADILAYAVLVHLFWPSRSILFMVNERPLPTYDLEITGLLDDMQETTLFSREGDKETDKEDLEKTAHNDGEEKKKKHGASSNGANGHLNMAYKDELSSDEDGH